MAKKVIMKEAGQCSRCGRNIKNVNRKLDVPTPNGIKLNCCSKECHDEMTEYYKGFKKQRIALYAEVAFGLAGIIAMLLQNDALAQICIMIDSILFLAFPYATFNPKSRTCYDETKRQSRSIALSLLLFIAIWYYFFVFKK